MQVAMAGKVARALNLLCADRDLFDSPDADALLDDNLDDRWGIATPVNPTLLFASEETESKARKACQKLLVSRPLHVPHPLFSHHIYNARRWGHLC